MPAWSAASASWPSRIVPSPLPCMASAIANATSARSGRSGSRSQPAWASTRPSPLVATKLLRRWSSTSVAQLTALSRLGKPEKNRSPVDSGDRRSKNARTAGASVARTGRTCTVEPSRRATSTSRCPGYAISITPR